MPTSLRMPLHARWSDPALSQTLSFLFLSMISHPLFMIDISRTLFSVLQVFLMSCTMQACFFWHLTEGPRTAG